jgi:hypothetical protein
MDRLASLLFAGGDAGLLSAWPFSISFDKSKGRHGFPWAWRISEFVTIDRSLRRRKRKNGVQFANLP